MAETPGAEPDTEQLDELAQLEQGLDCLVDWLDRQAPGVDDDMLVAVLRRFERFRNRLPLADHRLVNEVVERQLPERVMAATPGRFLSSTLRVSTGEAQRRLRAAAALSPQVSLSGVSVPPRRPVLAAAQQAGEVSTEQVAIIERALRSVDRGFDPADIATGEQLLTEWAGVLGVSDGLCKRVLRTEGVSL